MIVYDGRDGQIVFHFLYLVSGVKLIVADARNARQTHETRNKRAEFDSVSAHWKRKLNLKYVVIDSYCFCQLSLRKL